MDIPTPPQPTSSTATSPITSPISPISPLAASLCPVCHQPVTPQEYFCPNCGAPLRPAPPSTKWYTLLGIYATSLFLPPLGLWPAWKYLRNDDPKIQRVGWIAVALTAISVVVSIWLFQVLITQLNASINSQINSSPF